MTKKHGKRSVSPVNPLTNQRLYTKPVTEEYRGLIFGLILCLVGGYFLFAAKTNKALPVETNVLIGGLLLLGMSIILSTLFGTLQSITLDGENLFFSYRLKNTIYKASEVISIERSTSVDMGSSTGILADFLSTHRNLHYYSEPFRSHSNQQYAHYVTLFITLKNGKQVEIPNSRHARMDVKRILLDWQARYNPPQG